MCGRFTLTVDPSGLQQAFPWLDDMPASIKPRYNISPSQPVAVVANDNNQKLDYFLWGLIPAWAKDPAIGNRLINARAETLAEKPSFRAAFRRRRCLVVADGFYEWQVIPGSNIKKPLYIHLRDKRPFAFAGLWELWYAQDGSEIRSCAIITTTPNALMEPIHNRMPVILQPESYQQWLDPTEQTPERLQSLLKPYPAELMVAYPVSRLVNNPSNDTPGLIEPALEAGQ